MKSQAAIDREYVKNFTGTLLERSGLDKANIVRGSKVSIAARTCYAVESDDINRLTKNVPEGFEVERRGNRVAMFWQKSKLEEPAIL